MISRSGLLTIFLLFVAGCVKTGDRGPRTPELKNPPVDIRYVIQDEPHQTGELRGRPVLLVLMRTADLPSQIYMTQVKKAFFESAGRTRFLVLTLDPKEAPFVTLYQETEDLPFPVGIAEIEVAEGKSDLGPVPALPATYVIDSNGKVVRKAPGIIRAEELVMAVKNVERR